MIVTPPFTPDNSTLEVNAGLARIKDLGITLAKLAAGIFPYIKLSNTQASGVSGGTATNGLWRVIPITTIDQDTGSNVVSLISNGIVLNAGTYEIWAVCPFYNTDTSAIRLYNTTDSAVIINGESNEQIVAAGPIHLILTGQFTIAAAKTLYFEYLVGTTKTTNGLGLASGLGQPEVFAQIILRKVG